MANIGDSSAMLVKKTGLSQKLTADQTPARDDEYSRIVNSHGLVSFRDGVARVDGSVAVSRAIGDLRYKQFIISEPETTFHQIDHSDDVLVLATDGLYMVYTEAELAKMVHEMRQEGTYSLEEIAQKITDECCTNYHCKDNVTVVLVDLQQHFNDFWSAFELSQQANSNCYDLVMEDSMMEMDLCAMSQMSQPTYAPMTQPIKSDLQAQFEQQAFLMQGLMHQTFHEHMRMGYLESQDSSLINKPGLRNPKLMLEYQHPCYMDLFHMNQFGQTSESNATAESSQGQLDYR